MNKLIASTLVSIGLTAASASLAMAQTVSPPATDGAQARHGMQHSEGKRAFSLPSERVEARLAYIKTALKITDAQQPQWNAFADTLRKQAAEGDKRIQGWRAQAGQRSERQRPTAIARIEREQQRHAAAVVRLNEILAAERPLYAALTADQKPVADELLAPHGSHGMFRHGGMHRSRA
jgi:LTXXQ motif family protein